MLRNFAYTFYSLAFMILKTDIKYVLDSKDNLELQRLLIYNRHYKHKHSNLKHCYNLINRIHKENWMHFLHSKVLPVQGEKIKICPNVWFFSSNFIKSRALSKNQNIFKSVSQLVHLFWLISIFILPSSASHSMVKDSPEGGCWWNYWKGEAIHIGKLLDW